MALRRRGHHRPKQELSSGSGLTIVGTALHPYAAHMLEQNLGQPPGIKPTFSEWLWVAVVVTLLAGLVWRAWQESAIASMFVGRDPLGALSLPIPPYALLPAVSPRTLEGGAGAARDAEREDPPADAAFDEVVGRVPLGASSLPVTPYTGQLPTVSAGSGEGGTASALDAERHASSPDTSFDNVKLLMMDGSRTRSHNVLLNLSRKEMTVLPNDGGAPLTVIPYRQVVKATYVHARDPRWDPSLRAPAGKLNVPGVLGRARHWLVVQTTDRYAILQLNEDRWLNVLQTLELRTGLRIDRPSRL